MHRMKKRKKYLTIIGMGLKFRFSEKATKI